MANSSVQTFPVPGWGVDVEPERRPGVPQEPEAAPPLAGALSRLPQDQIATRPAVMTRNRPLTPVYSSANPPSGLSGVVRRIAYRYPEHRARRWMLLMMADRIDIIEHNPRAVLKLLLPVAVLALGIFAVRKRRRSPALPPRALDKARAVDRRSIRARPQQ